MSNQKRVYTKREIRQFMIWSIGTCVVLSIAFLYYFVVYIPAGIETARQLHGGTIDLEMVVYLEKEPGGVRKIYELAKGRPDALIGSKQLDLTHLKRFDERAYRGWFKVPSDHTTGYGYIILTDGVLYHRVAFASNESQYGINHHMIQRYYIDSECSHITVELYERYNTSSMIYLSATALVLLVSFMAGLFGFAVQAGMGLRNKQHTNS